jgi:pantoate--beta-alanine ligase
MGALHEGHLSLVRHSRQTCQRTVVSIFVNPTQFAAGEDYQKYPRPIAEDLAMLEPLGVDVVLAPPVAELYPPDFSTYVQPPQVSRGLEGEMRPTHFQGVATIVLKLFELVRPDVAVFGQKDYQQALVIQHMVRDLNVPVDIAVRPTFRDADGLALSSRNRYLSPAQRVVALSLYHCLQRARTSVLDGETDGRALMAQMSQWLIDGGVSSIDYAVLCDPTTLEIANAIRRPVVALVACRVGTTRLIDNVVIE